MAPSHSKLSGYVVGAYPASPAHKVWDPALETEFFSQLQSDPRIAALELPWLGSIHPHDDGWLLRNFPRNFRAVITDIPYVMSRIGQMKEYGIASSDDAGRNEALADLRKIEQATKILNDAIGSNVVLAIEIHTAPQRVGSIDALKRSLTELMSWDWDGASLVIEHCDAWSDSHTPEKGFLTLEDEVTAIKNAEVPCGISLNWGRSAIEFRDGDRVLEHVDQAQVAGLLQGFIFSGASDKAGDFGAAWADGHHPLKQSATNIFGDSDSLLTPERVRSALARATSLEWCGAKVSWPSSKVGTVKERAQLLFETLDALDSAI